MRTTWMAIVIALLCSVLVPIGPAGSSAARASGEPPPFDIQAHRGGMGHYPEGTLAAFANALSTGVRTLELDVQITKDGRDVVTHDRRVDPNKCRDTGPVQPGDPRFPYVGEYIKDLTFAQVRTLDCGSRTDPEHPNQRPAPGARMSTLRSVFALAQSCDAQRVRFMIEPKFEAAAPDETAPRERFVRVVANEVREAGMTHRSTIESFDWALLRHMREAEPGLPIVALTEPEFLEVGEPGASPWLGGLDIDDFGGEPIAAARTFGADGVSPLHGTPQDGAVGDADYVPFTTPELVSRARHAGMKVIPWTVNDVATMRSLLDMGVDGLITDDPDRLRTLLAHRGVPVPEPVRCPVPPR